MKTLVLVATAAVAFGCGGPTSATWSNSSGSVALSRDDALVYAVDTDNGIVAVRDAVTLERVADVKVGRAPQQIAVASDDVLYVSNRADRSVSIIPRGEWQAVATVAVGVEPAGLAVSPDAKTLYVVNATSLEDASHGTLLAIDTASHQRIWELPVGEEPRSIALVGDGSKALVTLFKKGDVVLVDLAHGTVIQDNTAGARTAVYQKANAFSLAGNLPFGFGVSSTLAARSASNVIVSPDGKKAHMTVIWSREEPILLSSGASGGSYSSGGSCNTSAIASPGIVTYDAETGEPETDDLTDCTGSGVSASNPSTSLGRPLGSRFEKPIQGSVAQVVDPTGAWLFVSNRESNNVAITPATRRTADGEPVSHLIPVGAAPDGIAITRDGRHLFVYSQFSHELSVLVAAGGSVRIDKTVAVAADPPTLSADFLAGRRLFFDATHPGLNDPVNTGISCNTCHTEGGREDGHVWGFPDGFRQTPALAGRMTSATAPYHWSGQFASWSAFIDHTIVLRMGGDGLTAEQAANLATFMDGAPAADNPHHLAAPSEAQLRGAQVFQQANCSSCHGGEAMTLNTMADVGTLQATDTNTTMMGQLTALNTPSLLGLARTAPYLHDGSALTLHDRISESRMTDQHGLTSRLTDAQIGDLVEYLKSL
jgi:YVTN family beta-propeller protein